MQSVMTWEQLGIYVAGSVAVYYTGLFAFFFRRQISVIRSPKKGDAYSTQEMRADVPVQTPDQHLVFEFIEDCKPVFTAAAEQHLERDQVLQALRYRVQRHPQLKGGLFQMALSNHIEQEVLSQLGWSLSKDELNALWSD